MKICLITDLHIDREGVFSLNIDTRANFLRVLEKISSKNYDLLILAGDLCHESGDEDIYQWIRWQLEGLHIPFVAISGNHDTSTVLAAVFGWKDRLHNDELYFTLHMGGKLLLFLDTSQGFMSENQWNWLNQTIETTESEVFIFMHHPPLIAGSLHMEPKYSFTQIDRFKSFCHSFEDKSFFVFTGHFHIERTIMDDNLKVFITPSTFVQIDPEFSEFKIQHPYIGFREIIIGKNANCLTSVVYL